MQSRLMLEREKKNRNKKEKSSRNDESDGGERKSNTMYVGEKVKSKRNK